MKITTDKQLGQAYHQLFGLKAERALALQQRKAPCRRVRDGIARLERAIEAYRQQRDKDKLL